METDDIFEYMVTPTVDVTNDNTKKEIGDVLSEIKTHLTKEELLLFSLYKNSKQHNNRIPKLFLEKYHGKKLTSSAISHRKARLMKVLKHVGILLRYKQAHNIDYLVKQIVTKKQFVIFMMYERRFSMKEIWEKVYNSKGNWTDTNKPTSSISRCFYAALTRLQNNNNPDIGSYLHLVKNVLQFSRKFPRSKW